tara:strand:+ start:305 stop:457 length:153 start_codon:yes stop_codon:yes gene_type:complete
MINRDKLYCAQQEVMELKKLLYEAKLRERNALKKQNLQGWLDYLWEIIGY